MRVRVAVPNRVDIAGGTLDIHPLYLLVPGAMTVNAAVTVRSVAEIRRAQGGARLVAEDVGLRLAARDTAAFPTRGPLSLVTSALRHVPPMSEVEVRVHNEAPFGSGLGASSALLVAVLLAAREWSGGRLGWARTAQVAMEIEAGHLGTLTGRQDHIAALRGGIQGIRFPPGGIAAERIGPGASVARALEAHGMLAFTGIAHRSGEMNWRMVRQALEGDRRTLRKFRAIAAAARDAWEALCAGDVWRTGRAVAREWEVRRTLSPGVLPAKVGEALQSRALRERLFGAKLCGAGGGGTLFALLREPAGRPAVEAYLRARGFHPMPFRLAAGPAVEKEFDGAES